MAATIDISRVDMDFRFDVPYDAFVLSRYDSLWFLRELRLNKIPVALTRLASFL